MSSFYMINATPQHAAFNFSAKWAEGKHGGSFSIRNHNESISINEGDHFACFIEKPSAEFNSEKAVMANKGVFEKITATPTQPNEKEIKINQFRKSRGLVELNYYIYNIEFSDAVPFKNYTFLDDYSYSLKKIYKRYLKPTRHFSRSITSIEKVDYETLEKERIYFERTLFGKLINSVPYQNRLQFMLYAIEKFENPDLRDIPLSKAFPDLKDFVGSGIIELGKILINSRSLVTQMSEIFGSESDIFFGNDSDIENNIQKVNSSIDSIKTQSMLFDDLFEISSNFEELFSWEGLQNSKDDIDVFNRIFSKRFWPVDINTDN